MKIVRILFPFFMWLIPFVSSAQIGYQVSLLNSATGEPRVAETVEVKIILTNSEGKIIHEQTQTETTNDFGILSLAVGNSTTFDDVDWTKLPFFISAFVDGKLVGKSQVLTVPVAEYAKRTGTLTKEKLCGKKWTYVGSEDSIIYVFGHDNSGRWYRTPESGYADKDSGRFAYSIIGDEVIVFDDDYSANRIIYVGEKNVLVEDGRVYR